MKSAPRILLGVTGSIAAYKAAELLRRMQRQGWTVRVVMTRAATEFVGELTFRTLSRHPVAIDMFAVPGQWEPIHLALAQQADVMVIAPCTANVIGKIAHGIADDLLSCTALSITGPLVVAPAMNHAMLDHPATVANLAILRQRGVQIVDSATGDLACGTTGRGRMADPADIEAAVRAMLLPPPPPAADQPPPACRPAQAG